MVIDIKVKINKFLKFVSYSMQISGKILKKEEIFSSLAIKSLLFLYSKYIL